MSRDSGSSAGTGPDRRSRNEPPGGGESMKNSAAVPSGAAAKRCLKNFMSSSLRRRPVAIATIQHREHTFGRLAPGSVKGVWANSSGALSSLATRHRRLGRVAQLYAVAKLNSVTSCAMHLLAASGFVFLPVPARYYRSVFGPAVSVARTRRLPMISHSSR